jgi:hypothetical protein
MYRHEPGPLFRLVSRPALSAREFAALRLADRLLGRVGSSSACGRSGRQNESSSVSTHARTGD